MTSSAFLRILETGRTNMATSVFRLKEKQTGISIFTNLYDGVRVQLRARGDYTKHKSFW